jgi:hypothetical protein
VIQVALVTISPQRDFKLKALSATPCSNTVIVKSQRSVPGDPMEMQWMLVFGLWLFLGASVAWFIGGAAHLDDSSDMALENER